MTTIPKQTRRSSFFAWVLLGPAIILNVFFFILPFADLFLISFFKHEPGEVMRPGFTFENYTKFLGDPFYLGKVWLTIRMGVACTIATLLLAYPVAYFLARRRMKLKGLLIGLLLTPLLTNFIVLVFAWLLFLSNNGLVNSTLRFFGVVDGSVNIVNSEYAVLIALVHVSLPYALVPLIGAIANIEPSLEEAAVGFGTSPLGAVLRVVVPLSAPGILAAAFIVFSIVLSSFAFALFLGGDAALIIPLLVWQNVDVTRNWPMASAISFVAFGVTLILLFVYMAVIRLSYRTIGHAE